MHTYSQETRPRSIRIEGRVFFGGKFMLTKSIECLNFAEQCVQGVFSVVVQSLGFVYDE